MVAGPALEDEAARLQADFCWPRASEQRSPPTLTPLLALSALAALYLAVLGVGGATVGVLLWPAFAAHAFLAVLLARSLDGKPTTERMIVEARRKVLGRIPGGAARDASRVELDWNGSRK